jgi:hypothetical protein
MLIVNLLSKPYRGKMATTLPLFFLSLISQRYLHAVQLAVEYERIAGIDLGDLGARITANIKGLGE